MNKWIEYTQNIVNAFLDSKETAEAHSKELLDQAKGKPADSAENHHFQVFTTETTIALRNIGKGLTKQLSFFKNMFHIEISNEEARRDFWIFADGAMDVVKDNNSMRARLYLKGELLTEILRNLD